MLESRREHSLDKFRSACETALDFDKLWPSVLKGISNGDVDLSFAAPYRADTNEEYGKETGSSEEQASSPTFVLSGTVGSFPTARPAKLEPSMDQEWVEAFNKSVNTRTPVLLQAEDGTLPQEMCEASTSRCYGDVCHQAVLLPSVSNRTANVHAAFIVGLVPRTP